ncbi:MAG TPA: GAF domain-containing protein [Gaiellaceae bacterium]|nr:GAF domain-containing protein [Gaiellaceae bacterium]
MSEATEAVLFNGVPLLLVAAAYAAVTAAVLPALWRDRARAHSLDWGVALVFPGVAVAAGIFGVLVLEQQRPAGGHVWLSCAASLAALAPAALLVFRWRDRAVLGGMGRTLDAEERASVRDRELEAVGEISAALSRARDAVSVARPLVRDVATLFRVGFTGVAVLAEDGAEATGLYAETDGSPAAWWSELRLDLGNEPSGIASAVFDAAPVTVYDVSGSPLVSARLAERVGAHSGAWVPMIAESRVVGVLVLASTDAKRSFAPEELSLLQALAAEAALALERLRSEAALSDALRREQRAAEIVRRIRAELEPAEVVRVARDELRSTLRLDDIAIDVTEGEANVEARRELPLAPGEQLLVEAVAYEIGAAVRTAALVAENRRRLEQQTALLHAAQVVTGELELEPVLNRLVEEVTKLLAADAADCYLLDRKRNVLRCAAVHGLDERLIGFEFTPEQGVAGAAIAAARPVSVDDYGTIAAPVPSPAYAGFSRALVAPMVLGGEMFGVIGVGIRDPSRAFDVDDEELLDAFASLASLALRNAESFAERSRQARVQLAFYRIATLLGEPLSLDQTYDAAAQAAAEALGGDFAAVLAAGPAGLTVVGGHELPVSVGELSVPAALADAAEDGQILAAPRVAGDERFEATWTNAPFASLLAIPVPGEGAWLVLVLFREEREFEPDDLELAQHVAGAARGAFERSRLFEAERTARGLSQQLARTGSLLATELDPEAVLEAVVGEAAELLHADAAALVQLDDDELAVIAAAGVGADAALGARLPSAGSASDEVVQSHGPVAYADARGSESVLAGDAFLAQGHAAYLGVPLAAREGAPLGVLSVYAREPREWREEEMQALVALAANASVAFSNAELYQRVAVEREQSVAILANIADGIVAVDRDGRVVMWNQAAAEITGVPAAEAVGRTPEQVLQRNLESEAGGTNRLVPIPRGDDDVWLSLSEAIMRDPSGAVAGRIFAFRDISAEHAVEQMKSDFVSTVSVELRTPLTSIYGFAQTLLREDVAFDETERRTFLDFIARESERLTTTVDALLNVARLDTGDLAVSLEPTDVGAVVNEVVTAASASGNGHRFVADVGGNGCTAQADPDKLRQVLDQLVSNAIKYSPEGGTVTVSASGSADGVQVTVADEGIGIPSSERDRIFSKFYRAGSGTGTGLGLFIARGLVREMGGRMWVESEEGAGSRFAFELPSALDVTFSTWEA